MRALVSLLAALALSTCAPPPRQAPTDGWRLVRLYKALSAEAPPDMITRQVISEDGLFQTWTNSDFTLQLEYGRYAD
jgi:hypothetical protein